MDLEKAFQDIDKIWTDSVDETLSEYISVPNVSPIFDPEWNSNGFQEQAVELLVNWVKNQDIKNYSIEVVKDDDKTPLIFIEVDSSLKGETKEESIENTCLLYGHFDKQPPLFNDWDEDLHPYKPVWKGKKLYGRGGADDGYSIFAAISALIAIQNQGLEHPRCVIVIEGCEESGSVHLIPYINKLSDRIGTPKLIVCLDSGAGNYEQMWVTSSLRGILVGDLIVKILNEGSHSGKASGIVPDSFRIIRKLLDRIEDQDTGEILVPELKAEISEEIRQNSKNTAEVLGDEIKDEFAWVGEATRNDVPLDELLLNKTYRAAVSYTGIEGLPNLTQAGNVLRPYTALKLSMRVPPNVDAKAAAAGLKQALENDPPYNASVEFDINKCANGWEAPLLCDKLKTAVQESSQSVFGKDFLFIGEGGSIPFMGLLQQKFPEAQFTVTGLLGPKSNAHAGNEFIDMDYARKLTTCIANIVYVQGTN
eukprot:TRINITY_DN136_c0_g1_i1.p1 TRINITY_DN136_c0_g1~~TRINITY_DN136_c0_g1_i1.p1  ORF type:complete len:479 (+),score=211.49 TRINITY_DN136_c0_g1_i1:56-1492(+)